MYPLLSYSVWSFIIKKRVLIVNVKLSIFKNTIKTYADMQEKFNVFLISALDGGESSQFHTWTILFMTFAGQEAGWDSKSVWKWKMEQKNILVCAGYQTLFISLCRVTLLPEVPQLVLSLELPHECYLFQIKLKFNVWKVTFKCSHSLFLHLYLNILLMCQHYKYVNCYLCNITVSEI